MSAQDVANAVRKMEEGRELANTAFHDMMVSQSRVRAANSTAHTPNKRWAFIENNDHLTPGEIDSLVTFDSPLYKMTLAGGDQHVARTSDRQTYFPGHESVAGVSLQLLTDIPDGLYTPEDTTVEFGYAGLTDGAIAGSAVNTTDEGKEGFALCAHEDSLDVRIYKAGKVVVKKPVGEWDNNPFADDRFDHNLNRFTLARWVFDLYGAGQATLSLRIRDKNGEAETVECVTIGDIEDPILDVYDLPVSAMVETEASAPAVEWACGPQYFANQSLEVPPNRVAEFNYNQTADVATSATFADAAPSVLKVYRVAPDLAEVATDVKGLRAASAAAEFEATLREVHPDYLTWPAGFDETDDANWRAPLDHHARETAIEEAKTDADTVTLATFTDTDGTTKPRGTQSGTAFALGGGGKSTAFPGASDAEEPLREHNYVVLCGRISDATKNPDLVSLSAVQRW